MPIKREDIKIDYSIRQIADNSACQTIEFPLLLVLFLYQIISCQINKRKKRNRMLLK